MSNSPKKHIIDSLLREIYGEKSPPDQTAGILRRLEENDQSLLSDSKLGKLDAGSGPYPTIKNEPAQRVAGHTPNWLVIAATLLFCIGLIGATIKVMQNDGAPNNVADLEDPGSNSTKNDLNSKSLPAKNQFKSEPTKVPAKPELASSTPQKTVVPENKGDTPLPTNPLPTFAQNTTPSDLIHIKSRIDQSFAHLWHINVIDVPRPIDKSQWINRVFEKLLGRPPESNEIELLDTYLTGDPIPTIENRVKIVETILSGETLAHEFSDYWADQFLEYVARNAIANNAKKNDSPEIAALKTFLRRSFAQKHSLSKITQELLTASGSVDSQAIEYNPAAGFLAVSGNNANRIAENVSRTFLGTELVCAKCHSDSAFEQSQPDYLGLAAFFQGTQVTRKTTGVAVVSNKQTSRKVPGLFFTDKNGIAVYAPPLIAGHDAQLNQEQPRKNLADQLVKSDRFATTMVNWVWEEIYGYGLSKSGRINQTVNAPHHQLMSELAEQLVAHEFDFRIIAKWAVLAEAFMASKNPPEDTLTKDIPKYGGVAFFSYIYDQIEHDPVESVNRLANAYKKPEGLTDAARLSLNVKQTAKGIEIIDRLQQGVLPNGLKVEDEIPDFARGWGVESKINVILNDITHSNTLTLEQKIEHLYLLALHRVPSRSELTQVKSLFTVKNVADGARTEMQVLQDIWWAIYPR